ncbi:DUF2306 domain-containing protein [uncultured Alcanivorax sp.]|uniref:DUF2306 domain-containing protein n=1 Tax=uncultured Alcanivorax sp. TaxID=191215 RepID=UPI0030DC51CA
MSDLASRPSPTPSPSGWRRTNPLALMLWAALALLLIGYGLIAFEAGTKISPQMNTTEDQLGKIDYLLEQARNDVSTIGSPESEAMSPVWVRAIERLHSSQYANSDDSVMPTERHYISMSDGQRNRLSLHMMLGLVLMTFGFFQFLPAFRRRFRMAHRVMGVLYVIAGFTSMAMSGSHLFSNRVSDIFNEYVFYMGLWVMLVIAVTGLSAAGYAIWRKNIAAHLGWQALAFGSFLTAPIQRIYWVGMAPFAGDATFNEMNILLNVSLFAQAFLAAYLLFYINRGSSPLRGSMRDHAGIVEAGKPARVSACAVAAFAAIVMLALYVISPGFAASESGAYMVPASAASWHDGFIVQSVFRYALVLAVLIQLALGLRLFLASEQGVRAQTRSPIAIIAAGLVSGGILISWGCQLGMPRHEISLAGTFYFCAGVLQWLFCGLFAAQAWRRQWGKMREALFLVLGMAMAPALLATFMWLLAMINIVPEIYREAGHGYQMAAAVALVLPILAGHMYTMLSVETKRYAVN